MGDVVRDQFAVDTIVPFLLWPLAAVLGYTITLYLSSDGVDDDEPLAEVSERSAP